MSIEIHVLSDQRLPSISKWQEAIEFEGDYAAILRQMQDGS